MRAAHFPAQGAPLETTDAPVPAPGPGELLLRIEACGICHSDLGVQAGGYPGLQYPRIPGHEVVGTVESLGDRVSRWSVGDRVGIGWHASHDGTCPTCRAGDFFACPQQRITGASFDGGYAEFMVAPADGVASVPHGPSAAELAPILCAGLTTFNALRNCTARPGDVVAILGLGGLGHLAVQYASRMGFYTVAIARGSEKADLARQLGAHEYIDSQAPEGLAALTSLGGARTLLATASDSKAIADAAQGLAVHGELLLAGAPREPIPVSAPFLLRGRRTVRGWYSGWAPDAEDALSFGAVHGVRAMIETFPLERAPEAFDRMIHGNVRFRAVLVA